jgi:hypothetical protein
MFFCPKCNFLLDIAKASGNSKGKTVKKIIDFINIMRNNDSVDDIDNLFFNEKDLMKNKDYKNLDPVKQKSILNKFRSIKNNTKSNINLVCNKCKYNTKLNGGSIIYKGSNKNNIHEDMSIINLRLKDQTLPRTKDYICPNKECDSHKKSNLIKKEAIFYRPIKGAYNLKYICTLCKTIWNP